MKDLWKVAFGVVCGLLAAGLILLVARPPDGPSIALVPPPTHAPLTVHVSGAVAAPGVYTIAPGSRVQDAIDAAGGLLPQADPAALNLAAQVQDGAQIVAPGIQPAAAPEATPSPNEQPASAPTAAPRAAATVPPISPDLININTADQAELELLPDVGPYRAKQIIAYRTVHGPYAKVEDLLKVPGVPKETYAIIQDLVTVGAGADSQVTPTPSAG